MAVPTRAGSLPRGQDMDVGGWGRAWWAGVVGVGCAGIGAWLGQRLGGSAATIGLGAATGAISGAFAPTVTAAILVRGKAREQIAHSTVLPRFSILVVNSVSCGEAEFRSGER